MVEKFDDITPPDTRIALVNAVNDLHAKVDRMELKLDTAIRPLVTPWYQRAAIVGGAVALILIAAEMLYYAPAAFAR